MHDPLTFSLSALLAAGVAPRPDDDLAALIARAERGGRIVGAICLGAAVRGLSPAAASRALQSTRRSHMSTWGRIARDAIQQLAPAHPLGSWRQLLSPDPTGEARGLDRWVTDYETALRHAGRSPPRSLTGALCAQLADFLAGMCERLAEPRDLAVGGSGTRTVARLAGLEWPTAPFLQLGDNRVLLWDSPSRGWAWLAYPIDPASTRPQIVPGPAGSAIGALGELERRAATDPVLGLLGDTDGVAPPESGAALAIIVVPEIDPTERAAMLVERWRGARRPVALVPVDPDDDPLESVRARVATGDQSARAALQTWHGRHRQLDAIVVVIAGRPRRVSPLEEAWRVLQGVAQVVVVTAAAHALGRWSMNERRGLRVVRDDVTDERPLPVSARIAAGMSTSAAWVEAATETFELDRPEVIDDLASLARGADLLDRPGLRRLWERGLIAIGSDGAARLAHPGWSALACGLAGLAGASHDRDAWEAGRRLAAERSRG